MILERHYHHPPADCSHETVNDALECPNLQKWWWKTGGQTGRKCNMWDCQP